MAVLSLLISSLFVMLAFPLVGLTQEEPGGFDSPRSTVVASFESAAVAAPYGGRLTVLPYMARNVNGRSTAYLVRNVSGVPITGTARYYPAGGAATPVHSIELQFASGETLAYALVNDTFHPPSVIPDGGWGSIVIESTGAVVAVAREESSNTLAGYNGVVLSQ